MSDIPFFVPILCRYVPMKNAFGNWLFSIVLYVLNLNDIHEDFSVHTMLSLIFILSTLFSVVLDFFILSRDYHLICGRKCGAGKCRPRRRDLPRKGFIHF